MYDKKGLYNGYNKKHKERVVLDYYSTPIEEVTNILNTIQLDFHNCVILEPCCGGGHMYQGIVNYKGDPDMIIATDIIERPSDITFPHYSGLKYDFLNDNYNTLIDTPIDYVIMNPPYSIIEPFTIKALEIAKKGVLMLGRLQFLESQGRYESIFKSNPPSDVYIYVDRIKCYKNGDVSVKESSAQAYAWFYWDFTHDKPKNPRLHWIRRI